MAITKIVDDVRTTTVLDAAKVTTGTIPEARITSLDSTKLTGTIHIGRLGNAPATDLTPVKNDISLLALQMAMNGNMSAYGLKNSWIEQFENSTYIDNLDDAVRNSSEYMSSISTGLGYAPSDSNTVFLMQSNSQANGSASFGDISSYNQPLTMKGTGVIHSTEKAAIGTSSIKFNGANGFTAPINSSTSPELIMAGDWTMEYWIWAPNSGGGSRVLGLDTGNAGGTYQQYTRHKTTSGSYGIGQVIHSSEANSAGVAFHSHSQSPERSAVSDWVHVAFLRQTKTIRAYFNGVQHVTWTKPTLYPTPGTGKLIIAHHSYGASGSGNEFIPAGTYLDDIRISNIARYLDGTTFTPNQVDTVNATGSFTSTVIVPQDDSNKSSVGLVILYKDNAGTTTLDADIVAQVRANTSQAYDSGSNTLVLRGIDGTPTPSGAFSDGLKIAIAPAIPVTAGKALSYKISFANQVLASKEARIYGVVMTY